MYFSPTCIFYNKINKFMEVNSLPCLEKKKIKKKVTLVVKPINFVKPLNYKDPSFFIGSNKLPKTDNYTYLGIPFDESLSLKPIQSKLSSNLNVKVKFVLSISF